MEEALSAETVVDSYMMKKSDSSALFFSTVTLLGVLLVIVVYQRLTDGRQTFAFMDSLMRRSPPSEKDMVLKVSKMQPAITVTRDTAALLLSVILVSAYSYINYLHTEYKGDLIASLMPLAVLGLLSVMRWSVSGFPNSTLASVMAAISGSLFTIMILYEVSCVRGHFTHSNRHLVGMILLMVSVLMYLLAGIVEGFRTATAVKAATNNNDYGASGTRYERYERAVRGFLGTVFQRDARAHLDVDKNTFMIVGAIDILIVGACVFTFAIVYTVHVHSHLNHWQYSFIALLLAPFVYMWYQIVYGISTGLSARLIFNILVTLSTFLVLLMFTLHAFDVFDTSRHTWPVAIPLYVLIAMYTVSVVTSSPMLVPILTVNCYGDKEQCVTLKMDSSTGETAMSASSSGPSSSGAWMT